MACLMMRRACKVCGEFHEFFLCDQEWVTDQRYEYRCPVTGQVDYLWDMPRVEAVADAPAGGVELRATGEESERR